MPMKIEDKDFFIKDLDIIEDYPIEKILIIDNSVLSFGENIKIVRRQRREHNTIKFKNDFCNLRLQFKKYIE